MNCYRARPGTRGALSHGFYALFYEWSLLNSRAAQGARCFHIPRASQSLKAISLGPLKRRSYSSRPPQGALTTQVDGPSAEEPALSSHLRKLMRTMPHSVVVATSAAPAVESGTAPVFKGMTVSSFTTLALTPSPIVTFNIRKPSQTLTAIASSCQFLIHILSATESGAAVADAFTKGNRPDWNVFHNPAFKVLKRQYAAMGQILEPPLLAAEGITKVLRCELLKDNGLVDIGDHVLVLGRVVGIIEPATGQARQDAGHQGLCYLDRKYRQIGSVIELPGKRAGSAS